MEPIFLNVHEGSHSIISEINKIPDAIKLMNHGNLLNPPPTNSFDDTGAMDIARNYDQSINSENWKSTEQGENVGEGVNAPNLEGKELLADLGADRKKTLFWKSHPDDFEEASINMRNQSHLHISVNSSSDKNKNATEDSDDSFLRDIDEVLGPLW